MRGQLQIQLMAAYSYTMHFEITVAVTALGLSLGICSEGRVRVGIKESTCYYN